jgi:hypothetical protein
MFKKTALIITIISPTITNAGVIGDFKNNLQAEFDEAAKDVIGSMSHRTLIPAEPLGIIGFDLGISANRANLNSILKDIDSAGVSALDSVSLHANKGLPLGFDVGVNYSVSALLSTLNATVNYAILDGGMATPAVAIKGSYTTTADSEVIDFSSYGVDLGVSKGFSMLTPFASLGMVNGSVKTKSGAIQGFNSSYSETTLRYAIGANVNIFIGDLLLAYNKVGEVPNISAKLGFRF